MAKNKRADLNSKSKTGIYIFKGNSHKGYQLTLAETLQARRVWHAVPKVTKGKQRIFYLERLPFRLEGERRSDWQGLTKGLTSPHEGGKGITQEDSVSLPTPWGSLFILCLA